MTDLLLLPAGGQQKSTPITAHEIAALKTAILDEIYDYDFEGEYIDISLLTPPATSSPCISIRNLMTDNLQAAHRRGGQDIPNEGRLGDTH